MKNYEAKGNSAKLFYINSNTLGLNGAGMKTLTKFVMILQR
jgi:hypothetical protein